MEKKFSFVKHLTKRDIEKIIEEIGLEIDTSRESREGEPLNPILRGTDDDGRGYVIVFCVDRKQQELNSETSKYLYENSPAFRKLAHSMGMLGAMMSGFGDFSSYAQNEKVILRIDDFSITESLSLKSEQDELENDIRMTNIYQKYMAEKFGRYYYNMKAGYIRKLNMDETKKSQTQEDQANEQERE